ncbi:MAG: 1-deoxy-D-xylulose-5-phosphate synthase [Phycisphaeraceae bacterium]|nr:1-deoxy-D-xylulose-5-phosphate synthase [Phycisphaeraceae bacterium]
MTKATGAAANTAANPVDMADLELPLLRGIHGPADLRKLAIDELPLLAKEIRNAICHQVSKTGGHLAPNLGVVELSIALHYVFDFATDRLLFDVGHQCYPHKLLTGRLDMLGKLRTSSGMSGFPEPNESPYDLFSVGHAGTAISTAVGMARADQLTGETHRRAVALIGDASIVNGLAMEGLNNAGTLQRQFLVVLNDNGMSIAKPQGALAQYFDRVRVNAVYDDLKKRAHEVLQRIPGGSALEEVYHRMGEVAKAALSHNHMFEQFGLLCLGPIDGHDIPTLIDMLNEIKDIDRPVLLHVKTVKGKGFAFTEGDATTFHSPKPFTVEGCRVELKKTGRSFTTAYADAMVDLMQRDEKIFAVTAAMPDGTGLSKVLPLFPQRSLDTGICESHAMAMCAGLAKVGFKPFFAVYSTFSQRALDQIFQEVSLQGLAVRVCMDRAGFVGGDGAVHHGFMDIAMFRQFPQAALLAACDEPTLRAGLEFMRQYDEGASFIRYPRDNVAEKPLQADCPPFVLGKANLMIPARGSKPDVAILAYGMPVYAAASAVDQLAVQGYDVALYDARFAKPVDGELIRQLIEAGTPILTVEDHFVTGGFGAAVLEHCADHRLDTRNIWRLGMAEKWIRQDGRAKQLAEAGFDAAGIARKVREIIETGTHQPAADVDAVRSDSR